MNTNGDSNYQKSLKDKLSKLYPNSFKTVIKKVTEVAESAPKFPSTDPTWYKKSILYVTYPDSFCKNGVCDLNALSQKIPYLKKLGINTIHILPFFKSPMIDMGFDVSSYLDVRDEVGGNTVFEKLIKKASDNGIRVIIDIVLNHISFQHEWFQKAIAGDAKYRKYFVSNKGRPKFIKKYKDDDGVWARYKIGNTEKDFFIIFPEQAGEIPHWIKADDGYWYFHTFYPHQIDLDWNNPDVFVEFSKILAHWASKGMSFRLDAIPFVGKNVFRGTYRGYDRTMLFVKALHEVVKMVSEDSVFLSEACLDLEEIKKYFGKESPVSELAYNFPLMRAIWTALLTYDTSLIWDVLQASYEKIPEWSAWVTFLRNHDELSLEACDLDLRKKLYSILKNKGLSFRDGFCISGRSFDFLGKSVDHYILAYFLLASLPGLPAVIYGDEIGKENDFDNMKKQHLKKVKLLKDLSIKEDTRDINRGVIVDDDIITPKSSKIFSELSKVFRNRKELSDYFQKFPENLKTAKGVFSARYAKDKQCLECYLNLNDSGKKLEIDNISNVVLKVGEVSLNKGQLCLGAFSGVWILHG